MTVRVNLLVTEPVLVRLRVRLLRILQYIKQQNNALAAFFCLSFSCFFDVIIDMSFVLCHANPFIILLNLSTINLSIISKFNEQCCIAIKKIQHYMPRPSTSFNFIRRVTFGQLSPAPPATLYRTALLTRHAREKIYQAGRGPANFFFWTRFRLRNFARTNI